MPAAVVETFFSLSVRDMQRATAFYTDAFAATVAFPTPFWSSLRVAGVRLGLALDPESTGSRVGLHFAVTDLAGACAEVERAGGHVVQASLEVAPGVVVAEVTDTEGNTFALALR